MHMFFDSFQIRVALDNSLLDESCDIGWINIDNLRQERQNTGSIEVNIIFTIKLYLPELIS